MAVGYTNDATFTEDIKEGLVLVDFYADWCGPCKMIAPVLDQLSGEFEGKARILKLNTDESPATARSFGVMSIPTLILFKDGQKIDQVMGFQAKPQLAAFINKHL